MQRVENYSVPVSAGFVHAIAAIKPLLGQRTITV